MSCHRLRLRYCSLAVLFAVVGCTTTPIDIPPTGSVSQPIVNQWFLENFNNYATDQPLNSQNRGWERQVNDDASPDINAYPVENGYAHGNVVVLSNKRMQTSATKAVGADTTGRFQNFSFQVKVDPYVPATSEIYAALVLADDEHAATVKFNFNGLGISLCGSNYVNPDCEPLFPNGVGDNGAPFQRIWYRIVVYLDQYVYNPTAYAEINVVGDPHIITRTNLVAIDSEPIESVTMYEYGRDGQAGTILLDYLLGNPKQ